VANSILLPTPCAPAQVVEAVASPPESTSLMAIHGKKQMLVRRFALNISCG
jgi:hypothetical protein